MQAMEISRTGLDVEWRRLEIISENLANAGTVRTANGEVFRPRHLLSGPRSDFSAYLDGRRPTDGAAPPQGVMVYGIEVDPSPPRRVREPDNPQADADGFVSYPAVNQAAEKIGRAHV